jgi:hypothetical protein
MRDAQGLDAQSTRSVYSVSELVFFPAFNVFLGNGMLRGVIDRHVSGDGKMPFRLAKRMFSFLDEEAVAHARLLLTLNKYTGPGRRELAPEKMHGMHIGAILGDDRVMSLVTVTEVRASRNERKQVPIR